MSDPETTPASETVNPADVELAAVVPPPEPEEPVFACGVCRTRGIFGRPCPHRSLQK